MKYIYRIIQILFNSSHNDLNKVINLLTHSAHFFMQTLCPSSRYKMISEFTWPNHDLPSDKDAVKRLLQGCGFDHDVAYGKTKVFIRTPRTLFSLEEQRAEMVQRIVLFLQKVRVWLNLSRLWIRCVSITLISWEIYWWFSAAKLMKSPPVVTDFIFSFSFSRPFTSSKTCPEFMQKNILLWYSLTVKGFLIANICYCKYLRFPVINSYYLITALETRSWGGSCFQTQVVLSLIFTSFCSAYE